VRESDTGSRWWYLLLLVPFIGLLVPPIYAHDDPELFGFPFFYWYQFAWVPASVLITYLVYVLTRARGAPPERTGRPPPLETEPGRPTPREPESGT
jgi:uncharacterized membrane protein YhaH (DUF805 family)